MAKKNKYAVHEDFKHYPSFPFPFNGLITGLLNKLLHLDTFFNQRATKNKATLHWATSADGTAFKIYEFRPDNAAADDDLPAVVYYHGGAFVLTYASTHIEAMDFYANQVNCAVFLVDYRLAPKNLFPKGFDDCYAAFEWVQQHAERLHVNKNKVAVMGDSAGGGFAAGVAQKLRDEGKSLSGQLLIYPTVDRSCSTKSATDYVDAPMFNGKANKTMWEMYLKNCDANNIPAYAAPGDCTDLSGLAKTYLDNAEFDPLCDEGAEYAKRLKEAGVDVELHEPKGTVHGYDTILNSDITQDSLRKRVNFLKSLFTK